MSALLALLTEQADELAAELDGPHASSIWRRYRLVTLQRQHHAEVIAALAASAS